MRLNRLKVGNENLEKQKTTKLIKFNYASQIWERAVQKNVISMSTIMLRR